MFSWSTNRQLIYGGSVFLLIVLIVGGILWKVVYRAPTCFDTRQNGDEKGVDCGGSCQLLCKSDALNPVVLWSRIFNVSGSVYTAVAYVENPNATSKNPKGEYEFKIYDDKNILIATRTGEISIPKNQKFAVFEPGINFVNNKPKYVEFTFTSFAPWVKDAEPTPTITMTHSALLATTSIPRIEGTISNTSLETIPSLELTAFVLDNKENVVAASRTFVENLVKRTSQQYIFTWPKPFDFGVESCSNTLDIALVLDRSGSMKSESTNPPEPFTTVLATAINFIKNLHEGDQVSVTSFGTLATENSVLSSNTSDTAITIQNISLSTTSEQTNITDGLRLAKIELVSVRSRAQSKKVIILLTDGVPTEPRSTTTLDYPVISANKIAQEIASSSITIYTIGLGKGVSSGFLKNIAGDESRYFFAPTKESLNTIYNKISTSLCEKKPNVINIMYRIP